MLLVGEDKFIQNLAVKPEGKITFGINWHRLEDNINLLQSTGHVMHQQFNNCTFFPHCIYVFCIYLRTNSDLCHLQHEMIGFYNREEKCLLRGTNWVFN